MAATFRRGALLALGVFAVELGLQAAGAVLVWREQRNATRPRWRSAKTRILCLGESTTAPGEHDWPLQLERLLDERTEAGRYAVINGAHGATTSGILLARLPALLDRYQPQIVIAMMGVNDSRWFGVYEDNKGAAARHWLAHLKLLKLAEFLYREPWLTPDPRRESAEMRRLAEARSLIRDGRTAEAKTVIWAIYRNTASSTVASAAGRMLVSLSGREDTAERLYSEIAAREKRADGDGFGGQVSRFGAIPLDADSRAHDSPVTAANYRRMGELLHARGVRLVAMQYPTRRVQELKSLTSYPPGTLFVDNGENFRAALNRRGYENLFTDRFEGSWGHCTAEGDRLIAENAYKRLKDAEIFPEKK